jgi:hypothetical protein
MEVWVRKVTRVLSQNVSRCTGVFVTPGFNPTGSAPPAGAATDLAGVNRLNPGSFDESGNGVIAVIRVEAQPAKLLFDLKHME